MSQPRDVPWPSLVRTRNGAIRCRRNAARPLEDGTGESRHQHRLLPIPRRLLLLGKVGPVADVGKRDPGINPAALFYQIGAPCPTPREGGVRDSGVESPAVHFQGIGRKPSRTSAKSPPEIRRFRCRRLGEAESTSLQTIASDESDCLAFRPPICAVTSESGVVSGKTVTANPLRATIPFRRRARPCIECRRPPRGRA
jgi:hypothetical protein